MMLKYRGGGGFNSLTSKYRSGTVFPFLLLSFGNEKLHFKGLFFNKVFNITDVRYSCIVLIPFKTLYLIVLDKDEELIKCVFTPIKGTSFVNSCEELLPGLQKIKFSFNFYSRLNTIAKDHKSISKIKAKGVSNEWR